MAEDLIELGKSKRPLVHCMGLGRAISRVECGISLAAHGVRTGRFQDLALGLSTARSSVKAVFEAGLMSPVNSRILGKIKAIESSVSGKKKISAAESKKILDKIYSMTDDTKALFQEGAKSCKKG